MIRLAAALCLLASPLTAQSAGEMTAESCKDSFDFVAEALGVETQPELGEQGWCRVQDLRLDLDDRNTVEIEELRWRVDGHERLIEGLPPVALSVEVDGLRPMAKTGEAVFDYLFAAQNRPKGIDGALDLGWDALKQEVNLRKAELDVGPLGRVEVTGLVGRVNLSDAASAQVSIGTARLTQLDVRIVTTGLFEDFALLPLGTFLLEGSEAPAVDVARYKSEAIAMVQSVPDEVLGRSDKLALTALISDLPNPSGQVDFAMQSDAGLGSGNILSLGLSEIYQGSTEPWDLLPDMTLSLRYAQTGGN